MFKRRGSDLNARLDRFGGELVRSAAFDDPEVDSAAKSTQLYAGIRSAINARRSVGHREQPRSALGVLAGGRLRFALATLSLVATGSFWLVRMPSQAPPLQPNVPSLTAEGLTACSISSHDKCVISTEDVLQLLVSQKLEVQGR